MIGSTIVSLRDGLDEDAIWAVEVDAGTSGAAGTSITWTPVDPSLPQIDLYEALARDEEDEAT